MTDKPPKSPRLSFKKEPYRLGLAGVGYPYQDVRIKADGRNIGRIAAPNWHDRGWRVSFAVVKGATQQDPAPFVWMRISKVFGTEDEARAFVKAKWASLCAKYKWHNLD